MLDVVIKVAPLAGAWIEISRHLSKFQPSRVAPLAGAWIEINKSFNLNPLS